METGEWKKELAESYISVSDIPDNFKLSKAEEDYFNSKSGRFRISIPKAYFALAGADEDDPLREML